MLQRWCNSSYCRACSTSTQVSALHAAQQHEAQLVGFIFEHDAPCKLSDAFESGLQAETSDIAPRLMNAQRVRSELQKGHHHAALVLDMLQQSEQHLEAAVAAGSADVATVSARGAKGSVEIKGSGVSGEDGVACSEAAVARGCGEMAVGHLLEVRQHCPEIAEELKFRQVSELSQKSCSS